MKALSLCRVSISEECEDLDNNVETKGTPIRVLYDTGAAISEKNCCPTNLTGQAIEVRVHKLDRVDIKIGDMLLKDNKVALMPERDLSGKGLMATRPGELLGNFS